MTVKILDGEQVVAIVDGSWAYESEAFQQYVESLMIEGVPTFGGDGPKHFEKDGQPGVADTIVTLVPGEEGFDEKFWDAIETDYTVEWEGENASSDVSEAADEGA